jgi:nucleoside-diphosphate-sugar epimerase
MSDAEKQHMMRVFVRGGAGGAVGVRFVPQLIDHGHKMTGTCGSPGNAERARAPSAEPITPGQQPARVWRRIVGGS